MPKKYRRREGDRVLYTPNQTQRYKSQWTRYQKGLALAESNNILRVEENVYRVPSERSPIGYWEITAAASLNYEIRAALRPNLRPFAQGVTYPFGTEEDYFEGSGTTSGSTPQFTISYNSTSTIVNGLYEINSFVESEGLIQQLSSDGRITVISSSPFISITAKLDYSLDFSLLNAGLGSNVTHGGRIFTSQIVRVSPDPLLYDDVSITATTTSNPSFYVHGFNFPNVSYATSPTPTGIYVKLTQKVTILEVILSGDVGGGQSSYTCTCPDFSKFEDAFVPPPFESMATPRNWGATDAGAPDWSDGKRRCYHIVGVQQVRGEDIPVPSDFPLGEA